MPQLLHSDVATFIQDKSNYVPAPSGNSQIFFTTASRGPIGVPTLVTGVDELERLFGKPSYSKLTYGLYAARQALRQIPSVWIVRCEHTGLATKNLVVPVKGVVTVYDGDTTPNILFVATAKGEGEWVNNWSIQITALDTTNRTVTFNIIDDTSTIVETHPQVDLDTINVVNSDYFSFSLGVSTAVVAGSYPASFTTATTSGTLGVDNWNTAATAAILTSPAVAGVISVQDATGTPKTVFTATAKTAGAASNLDNITVTYFNTTANLISFDVYIDGTLTESFNSLDITTLGSVNSAYYTFANVDTAPFTAPSLPAVYTTADTGGTLGVDAVVDVPAFPAPYTDTDTVASWIATQMATSNAIANADLYPANLVLAPGYANGGSSATLNVMSAMHTLCSYRKDCYGITSMSRGLSASQAVAERAAVGMPTSDVMSAPYYPWLKEYDTTIQQDVTLPPDGWVAEVYAFSDSEQNIWDAPAGLNYGLINGSTGLEDGITVDGGVQDILYPSFINPIAYDISARSLYVNGQKGLVTKPSKLDRVSTQRLLIVIANALTRYLNYFRFDPNIPATWDRAAGGARAYLDDILSRNGLEAYNVVCDNTTNTAVRRDRNEMWMNVGVIPVGHAEFIYVPISVYRSGSTL